MTGEVATWLAKSDRLIATSSFFTEGRSGSLPHPAHIRALNAATGDWRAAEFDRPTPVRIPSLGLFVKYGADVTVGEAHAQIMIRDKLGGEVPVPEVFGWAADGGQVFIYMQLIDGDTVQSRWHLLDESERLTICAQLRRMASLWRTLPQGDGDSPRDVGSSHRQPLNDIFLKHRPQLIGPFEGRDAVEQFQQVCGIDILQEVPIVFTHADLVAPNILLTPGPSPSVAAVIDWGQAGWYPSYWEYCKARRVDVWEPFGGEVEDEWRAKYLPMVLDPVNDETIYHPWLYFVLSKGI